jgi:hypothetical protein
VGDVNLLRRIWKFLHSWQLINYLARRAPQLQGAAVVPAGSAGEPDTPLGSREGERMLFLCQPASRRTTCCVLLCGDGRQPSPTTARLLPLLACRCGGTVILRC